MTSFRNSLTLENNFFPMMNDKPKYVHLLSSMNISELALIKHALQNANIDFEVKNENIMAIDNVAGMGIDGAWVQVAPDKREEAKQLLVELGLLHPVSENEGQGFIERFGAATENIPLLNQLPPALRVVLVGFLIIAIPFVLFALSQV